MKVFYDSLYPASKREENLGGKLLQRVLNENFLEFTSVISAKTSSNRIYAV